MSSPTQGKTPTIPIWLSKETRKASPAYATPSPKNMGTDDIAVTRYISREFHEKEISGMWSRVWQMACHETDIPDAGDFITYEIGLRSFIVVRVSETQVKAYPNACLHRGMQLVDGQGQTSAFGCKFHGWTWNLDGSLRKMTEDWDFPQSCGRDMCLPEAAVGRWGGFVFINPDGNAAAFEEHIGNLNEHFESAPLDERRIAVHVARVMPANWKVAMEAFLESYHVSPTHPQSVPVSEYAETQYDIYGPNVSRLATVSVAPAAGATKGMSEQEFADYASKSTGREPLQLTDGQSYRSALAAQRRSDVAHVLGKPVDYLTDVEMLDAVEYFVFPNFLPWHGFGLPIVYRFRPNGDRHDSSIMEIYLLAPRNVASPAPRAAAIEWLPEDRPFAEHKGLGRLGPIFDQDYANIVGVWKGLHSTVRGGVMLGQYQESRIRHYHRRIDDFVAGQEV